MNYKKARKEKGFSQTFVAVKVGISLQGYQNIESGATRNPRSETLEKLKKLLK